LLVPIFSNLVPRQLGKNELPPYHNNLSRGFAESLVGFIITLAVLKMGQFGKRRLNFLGALIMGFSFFIFKFIAKTVHLICRQTKRISSKILSLTTQYNTVQDENQIAEKIKPEGK
jgi:hypothetical protein|tara:strand:+ start:1979 stop:2326 length:348 start_codon:yes stop_codon:yes gene_type:complete